MMLSRAVTDIINSTKFQLLISRFVAFPDVFLWSSDMSLIGLEVWHEQGDGFGSVT
jgi:hypothetical protein